MRTRSWSGKEARYLKSKQQKLESKRDKGEKILRPRQQETRKSNRKVKHYYLEVRRKAEKVREFGKV